MFNRANATYWTPTQLGHRVVLSIRPEAVDISAAGSVLREENAIQGRLAAAAYQGSYIEYEVTALDKALKAHAANPKGTTLFMRETRSH